MWQTSHMEKAKERLSDVILNAWSIVTMIVPNGALDSTSYMYSAEANVSECSRVFGANGHLWIIQLRYSPHRIFQIEMALFMETDFPIAGNWQMIRAKAIDWKPETLMETMERETEAMLRELDMKLRGM